MMGRKWQRTRAGMNATDIMVGVLRRLRDAEVETDNPFLVLDDVHARTLQALIRRDWIVMSWRDGSNRGAVDVVPMYRITGRGRKALAVFKEPSLYRTDGICPRCGENPVHVFSSGNKAGYCHACLKLSNNRSYALFGYQKREGQLCPMCGERERHITASGNVRSYCLPCRRKRNKRTRKRYNAQLLKRIEGGEVLLCYGCHEKPRKVFGQTVSDYCHDCYRAYQNEYHRRQKRDGFVGKYES